MDFGLAKREAGEITMTMDGQVLGTPACMSPEQAKTEAHVAMANKSGITVVINVRRVGHVPFRRL